MGEELNNILLEFSSIGLADMEKVKLMNRVDVKYTFNIAQLNAVLHQLKEQYSVVEISEKRICQYNTLYYDTQHLNLYTKHQNGELNRYKIRHRTYVDSELGFLEVKFKNNKGRTIKERIKEKEVPYQWQEKHFSFLNSELTFDPAVLQPTIWVNYKRITLVNKNSPERVTIDIDLEFVHGDRQQGLSALVIAEVKQDKKQKSPFIQLMKKMHIREGSISKYCMAICYSCEHVKKNNFKEQLNNIKQIIYDDAFANSHR